MEKIIYLISLLLLMAAAVALLVYARLVRQPATDNVLAASATPGQSAIPAEGISYSTPDFRDRSDFHVTSMPQSEIIHFNDALLMPGGVAQLRFTIEPNWPVLVRVAPTSRQLDLSDLETSYDNNSTDLFDGVVVQLHHNPGGAALATWDKNGFHYALYFSETEMGLFPGNAHLFVKGMDSALAEATPAARLV